MSQSEGCPMMLDASADVVGTAVQDLALHAVLSQE